MIRVLLPHHLRTLAQIKSEVEIQVEELATQDAIIDALELKYPMLRGTIRDQVTKQRRPFIRFFACGEDMSLAPSDSPLPDAIVNGTELFRIVGAMAGG
jgi:molybdopterin synthase sulfur carrier subunit